MFGRVGTLSSAAGTYDVVFGIGDPVDGGDGAVPGVLSYESVVTHRHLRHAPTGGIQGIS